HNIQKIDAAWDQVRRPPMEPITDFWQARVPREMKGPDGIHPISSIPQHESRILLSLAIDWFNPYHNKIAGKSASTGVMFMTCLNLPLMERLKPENIYFVGIMPGKKQQSNLDGILRPLVDELLEYWNTGVYLTGLPGIDCPRLVRSALVQLICDLPAARSVAGRGAADKLLKADPRAVRWSELNRLPYWNPITYTVLDAMHLILLGMCQFHWRKFWGGDHIPSNTGDATIPSLIIPQSSLITGDEPAYPSLE
ncbi:268_t:CDS:2, partial [Acaulospora colombiana]